VLEAGGLVGSALGPSLAQGDGRDRAAC
jgi:hypothetical protein